MSTSWSSSARSLDVAGRTPGGRAYRGLLEVEPDGDAALLRWTLRDSLSAETSHLAGIAVTLGPVTVVTRAPHDPAAPDPLAGPGSVVYDVSTPGTLSARWYHPSLGGRLGRGASTAGPVDGLCGTYRADYASAEGEDFAGLSQEVAPLRPYGQDERLDLTWTNGDGEVEFGGLGVRRPGDLLVVGWSSPPRDDLEHGHLADGPGGSGHVLTWWDRAAGSPGSGRETWQAPAPDPVPPGRTPR